MADNGDDVPPLEDMTEVLSKAEAIRISRNGPANNGVQSGKLAPKERAKVTKKSAARVVAPAENGKGDQGVAASETKSKVSQPPPKPQQPSGSSGMFGGMKKGFLFGGSSVKPNKTTTSSKTSTTPAVKASSAASSKDNIPYISPKTGKTESGLTFDEVQQAMSEAKGLLDNQDWITEDLLTKIEKNSTLRTKFADPSFMQALEDFQKNPEEAMKKYKGNTEVERFLQEFCGLLGDHFTNMGGNSDPQQPTSKQTTPVHRPPPSQVSSNKTSTPKITELTDSTTTPAFSNNTKSKPGPKIVELTEGSDKKSAQSSCKASTKSPKPAKTVDLSESADSESEQLKIGSTTSGGGRVPDIWTYSPGAGADMQEVSSVPAMADDEVKEVLKDPKVMETLMDPEIMNIIQLLRSDPMKAQRIVDTASGTLKERITLLIMKGLLRFQAP